MSGDASETNRTVGRRGSATPLLGLDTAFLISAMRVPLTGGAAQLTADAPTGAAVAARPEFGVSDTLLTGTYQSTYLYLAGHGVWGAGRDDDSTGEPVFFWPSRADDPSPATTPTIGDVVRQIVSYRTDIELDQVRARAAVQRGFEDLRSSLAKLELKIETAHTAEPMPSETHKVEVSVVVRKSSQIMALVFAGSLVSWLFTRFPLVNPFVSLLGLVASPFFYAMAHKIGKRQSF